LEIRKNMNIELKLGDCLEVLKTIPDNSIDSVITDPPYHLTSIVKRFGKEVVINNESVKFKVWIDCNQTNNKIIDTSEIFELVSKLYPDHGEGLNNVNYHLMVDDIYERLAAAYPDTSIWIEVTNDDFGLLAKYETRTPSSLLKI